MPRGQPLPPHVIGRDEFAILSLRIARCTIFGRDSIPYLRYSDKLFVRVHFPGHEADSFVDVLPGHTVIGSQPQPDDAGSSADDNVVHYKLVGDPGIVRKYFGEIKPLSLILHHFSCTNKWDRIGVARLVFVEEDVVDSGVVSRRMILPVMSELKAEIAEEVIGKMAVEIIVHSKANFGQKRGTSQPNNKESIAFDKSSEDLSFMKIEALTYADTGKLPQWPSIGNIFAKHHDCDHCSLSESERSGHENGGNDFPISGRVESTSQFDDCKFTSGLLETEAFQGKPQKKFRNDLKKSAASGNPDLLDEIVDRGNMLEAEIEKILMSKNVGHVTSSNERLCNDTNDMAYLATDVDNLSVNYDEPENETDFEERVDAILDGDEEDEIARFDEAESFSITSLDVSQPVPRVSFPSLVVADEERYQILANIDLLQIKVEKVIFDVCAAKTPGGVYALRYSIPPLAVGNKPQRNAGEIVEVPLPRHSGHSKSTLENRKSKRAARVNSRFGGNMFREYVLSHSTATKISFQSDSDVQCWLDLVMEFQVVLSSIKKNWKGPAKLKPVRKRSMNPLKFDAIPDISGTPVASCVLSLKDVLFSPELNLSRILPLCSIDKANQNTHCKAVATAPVGSISVGISLVQRKQITHGVMRQKSSESAAISKTKFSSVQACHGPTSTIKCEEDSSSLVEHTDIPPCHTMHPKLTDLQPRSNQTKAGIQRRSFQLHIALKSLTVLQHNSLAVDCPLVIRASYSPGASSRRIACEVRVENIECATFQWQPIVDLELPSLSSSEEGRHQNMVLVLEVWSSLFRSDLEGLYIETDLDEKKHGEVLVGMFRASLSSVTAAVEKLTSSYCSAPCIVVNDWCELTNPLSGNCGVKALMMVAVGLRSQISALQSLEEAAKKIQLLWKRRHQQTDDCKQDGEKFEIGKGKASLLTLPSLNNEQLHFLKKKSLSVKFHLELRPTGTCICINCENGPLEEIPDGCYIKFTIRSLPIKDPKEHDVWWDATSSFLNGCARCEFHKPVVDASGVFSVGCDQHCNSSAINVSVCGITDGKPSSVIATSIISYEQMCELSQNSYPSKRVLLKLPLDVSSGIFWLPNMLEISARLAIEPRSLAAARSINNSGANFDFKLPVLDGERNAETRFHAFDAKDMPESSSGQVVQHSGNSQRDFVRDTHILLRSSDTKVVVQIQVDEVCGLGELMSQWNQIRSRDPFEFPPKSGLFISCTVNVRDRPLSDLSSISKVFMMKEVARGEHDVLLFDLFTKFRIETADIGASTLDITLWFMPLATPVSLSQDGMFVKTSSLRTKAVLVCSIVPIPFGSIFTRNVVAEGEHILVLPQIDHNRCNDGSVGGLKVKIQFQDDEDDASSQFENKSQYKRQSSLPVSRPESSPILPGQNNHNLKNFLQYIKRPLQTVDSTTACISETKKMEGEKGLSGIMETLDSIKSILGNGFNEKTNAPCNSATGVAECDSPSNDTFSSTTTSNYFLSLPSSSADSASRRQSFSSGGEGTPCIPTQSISSLPLTSPAGALIQTKKVTPLRYSSPCKSCKSISRDLVEEATRRKPNDHSPTTAVVIPGTKNLKAVHANQGVPRSSGKSEECNRITGSCGTQLGENNEPCVLSEGGPASLQISAAPIFVDETKCLEPDKGLTEVRIIQNDDLSRTDDFDEKSLHHESCHASQTSQSKLYASFSSMSRSGDESDSEKSNKTEHSQNRAVSFCEDIISCYNSNSGTLTDDEKQDSNEWVHSDLTSISCDSNYDGMSFKAQTETDRISQIMGCYPRCGSESESDSGEI